MGKHEPLTLPPVNADGGMTLWECLTTRRSVREYGEKPLTLDEFAQLIWAAQGITARSGEFSFRTAPSAGALYPLRTYPFVRQVKGVRPGIYYYLPDDHALTLAHPGDFSGQLAKAAMGQGFVATAAIVFVWTAIPGPSTWRYGNRGWRYVYIDAGHAAENLHLAATALGLGCCAVGAFSDQDVNKLLGVDPHEETVVYMMAVGRRE